MATPSEQPPRDVSQKLREAVRDARWAEVITAIDSSDCREDHRQWAVMQTVKHAAVDFVEAVLDNCAADQLDTVFKEILRRELWGCADILLQRKMSRDQHRRAVKEALKLMEEESFAIYVLPHCTKEELEEVVTLMVAHDMWWSVDQVLQRGVSSTQRRWAVDQAIEHAGDVAFVDYIVPHCHEDQLERALSHLVSRRLWVSVGKVLERCADRTRRRWALEQISKHASYDDFVHCILPHCRDEELEHVLPHLVLHGLWVSVGKVLEQGINAEQHQWVVEQAIKHASDDDFVHCIVPYCHAEEMKHVLFHLVSRGLWQTVGEVLARGVGTSQHRWAVEQAIQHASDVTFVDYILPQCHDVELEHVLTHLVSKGLWKSVGKGLERGVGSAKHRWAVDQACQHADDGEFFLHILPQCQDEDMQQILAHLVSQNQWDKVGKVLQQGVSCAQHRWTVEQASQCAKDEDFVNHLLLQCHEEELEHVTPHLVSRGLWRSVGKVLERGVSSTQHRWAVEEAASCGTENSFCHFILRHCSGDDVVTAFPLLLAGRKWSDVTYTLYRIVCDTVYTWLIPDHERKIDDTVFWKLVFGCRVDSAQALDLTKAAMQEMPFNLCRHPVFHVGSKKSTRIEKIYQTELYKTLVGTLLHLLCSILCSNDREDMDASEHIKQRVSDIYTHIAGCIKDNTHSLQFNILMTFKNKSTWTKVFTEVADTHKTDSLILLHFLQGLNLYHVSRRGWNDDVILLVIFAVFPLFPQLQSTALRMLLQEKKWDIIRQACLSHVWEHDRRQLFKAAVEQGEWDVVRQWADHTLHNDQRDWAMKEAFREKQWQVYLLLADHGLTMQEHMHACYIVAKYGDWDTVLQMVERGVDITEVSNLLENWVTGHLRIKPKGDSTVFLRRCEKLIRLRLRFAKNSALHPMKSLKWCLWGSVLFNILHQPTEEYFSLVLHKVIEKRHWHILMHLVRLGMTRGERDWLFPQMVRQQQWGVCRKLLEIGVDVHLCLEALPELLEKNQWTLVARVMEYGVDDAVRCQVMQCAFQRREGVLFWHCLTTMENKEQMSVETRVRLFHQAISRDAWQAVMPLVEEKDELGQQQRDLAFLEAIEQHLWDVVDHCQVLGADINMEDENGETPLHREARKEEWKAVEEIVFRDGKPNLLDKDGVSVLNRLVDNYQWDTVKLVIKYGGDIHLAAKNVEHFTTTNTPLQALIDHYQGDIIQFSVMWCPEQRKGVNKRGETTLHAACASDRWDGMEDLVVRQVDPLAVTETGQTALVYAVLNTRCPHRMVAECCRLGFSSHQPSLAGSEDSLLSDITDTITKLWYPDCKVNIRRRPSTYVDCDFMRRRLITSPLVCAVLRDVPAVILMLYESGSSSRTDLCTLSTQLLKLTDRNTPEGRSFFDKVIQRIDWWKDPLMVHRAYQFQQYYLRLLQVIEKNAAFLRQLAATPRTLLSSCRLLILRHFPCRDKKRQQRLRHLPLMVPLKNYLQFSDFCDRDFAHHVALPAQSPQSYQFSSDDTNDDEF